MTDPAAGLSPVTAILPLRGSSQRVPGKNRRLLAGRPLFHHILSALRAVPEIDTVAVNSDEEAILEEARRVCPGVVTIRRPEALSAPETSMNAVLLETLDHVPSGGLILQTHATNPFLSPASLSGAIAAVRAVWPRHDSLFSVTRRQVRLWDGDAKPVNHDPARLLPTQDLPPLFEENSCLYLFTADLLRARGTRIGARPLLWPTPPLESLDIDEEADFTLAEALAVWRAGQP